MSRFIRQAERAFIFAAFLFTLVFSSNAFPQQEDFEFILDASGPAEPLPKIFRPNIDLSGRGFHSDNAWPQTLAAKETLESWKKDIGYSGIYRLQYSLWDISQASQDKELQKKLLANYESIIREITDSGGIVILNIFGTPKGMGEVLDKKSPPRDLRSFKKWVKGVIRDLSCNKRYNIWYEVWNAPDLDDFFLGRKQEYLNLYRVVAESIMELRLETKTHIPVGGPCVSWWFQNQDGNTVLTPERSLIYEFIKTCYRYRLPLDFISWHTFSSDPAIENENTIYNKNAVVLIREWLSYFGFEKNTPLVIDEWNFDLDQNVIPERHQKSFICSSYIPARIKQMRSSGIDYQVYFCLEDFQNNLEGLARNTGIFSYDPSSAQLPAQAKSAYNVFRMFGKLGNQMLNLRLEDDFIGAIATKGEDYFAVIFYNYIDPKIAMNFLSKNIANLSGSERKFLLKIIKSGGLEMIMSGQRDALSLRTTNRVRTLLKKARELKARAKRCVSNPRTVKLSLKNIQGAYLYSKYCVDSGCGLDCPFEAVETKEVAEPEAFQEVLTLNPYSVCMVILKKKSEEPKHLPSPENQALLPEEMKFPHEADEAKSQDKQNNLPGTEAGTDKTQE